MQFSTPCLVTIDIKDAPPKNLPEDGTTLFIILTRRQDAEIHVAQICPNALNT